MTTAVGSTDNARPTSNRKATGIQVAFHFHGKDKAKAQAARKRINDLKRHNEDALRRGQPGLVREFPASLQPYLEGGDVMSAGDAPAMIRDGEKSERQKLIEAKEAAEARVKELQAASASPGGDRGAKVSSREKRGIRDAGELLEAIQKQLEHQTAMMEKQGQQERNMRRRNGNL